MKYGELTSPELGRLAPGLVALLPLAAIEQHGNHLPIITDTAIVSELANRVEAALPRKVALLPTFWVGSSHHHLGFPGTMSLRSETYILVLQDLIESLLTSGFRRVVLLNGHGGNTTPAAEALYRVALNHPEKSAPWVACATYWQVAREELASQKFMETPKLTHACEYETSLMLGLRTDWVDLRQAKGRRAQRNSRFYDPLGYAPSKVSVSETFAQLTENGAMGRPDLGSAEKGRKLYDLITPCLVDFVKDFSSWKFNRRSTSV
jgi:creatinine amidohydrolase